MKKYLLLLVVIGFLLYLPSFSGPFLWDDEDFVYANQYVKEFRIDKFFTESQTAGRAKASNYFRPIPQIAYATIHAVFTFNPFWFHIFNVIVHIGAACTIFVFFQFFLKHKMNGITGLPFFIALMFLIHPVQTEAVSYISGLSDPLFVFFGFLSLISFLKKRLIIALLFFCLALLTKETALVFLPLLLLLNWKKVWPFLAIALGYLWYHFVYINEVDMHTVWGNHIYAHSVMVRLLTFVQNLYAYIALLIFPKDLFMERDYSVSIQTQLINPYLLGFIILNALIIWLLFRLKNHQLIFCYLAFFITFIPYTGVILINGIFYEHFLYLPLSFFFGFWFILFEKYLRNKYVFTTVIVVFVLLAMRNFVRQYDWNDSIRFYTQTLTYAPHSVRILNGLGMVYAEQGNFDEAIRVYQSGIDTNPGIPNLYHNLANIYVTRGEFELAEQYYATALSIDPHFSFSVQNLAKLYQQTGQKEKLEKLIGKYAR